MRKSPLPAIKKKTEFREVFRKGKCTSNHLVRVHYLLNQIGYTRLGVQASKSVGNAVTRNRFRRLIKEGCRLMSDRISTSFDIVIVAKPTAKDVIKLEGLHFWNDLLCEIFLRAGLMSK